MKKSLLTFIAAILVLAVLAACASPGSNEAPQTPEASDAAPEAPEAPEASEDNAGGLDLSQARAGLAIHFLTDDYGVIASQAFEEVMRDAGVGTISVLDANGDAQKQLADMESFVDQGYDMIVILPIDELGIVDIINRATEQGIIVVAISYIPGANVTATVNAKDFEFSYEVGSELAALMNYEGTIAFIDASVDPMRITERRRGFMAVVDEHPGLEIVTIERRLMPDEARIAAEGILIAHPELDAIWGIFSNLLYGAAAAARDMGRDELIIGGVDADMAILNLMREGWIHAVAAQLPYSAGELAAQAALNAFLGNPVSEEYLSDHVIYLQGQEEQAALEVWNRPLE